MTQKQEHIPDWQPSKEWEEGMWLLHAMNNSDILPWIPQDASMILDQLERTNLPPWMCNNPAILAKKAEIFPEGQIVIKTHEGDYLTALSANRIHWDGDTHHLPKYQEVVGNPPDFSKTFDKQGNTLVITSFYVRPVSPGVSNRADEFVAHCVDGLRAWAQTSGITYLLGALRPTWFLYAKQKKGYATDFAGYCLTLYHPIWKKPRDMCLLSFWKTGFDPVAVEPEAHIVNVPFDLFNAYKQSSSYLWEEVSPGLWECGENGFWITDEANGIATYKEGVAWYMRSTVEGPSTIPWSGNNTYLLNVVQSRKGGEEL